jgi:hypothetical protein
MKLEDIALDDILQGWHDAGASKGMEPVYYRVLKVARVKVRVRCETGDEGWMYPAAFTRKMRPEQVDFVTWR